MYAVLQNVGDSLSLSNCTAEHFTALYTQAALMIFVLDTTIGLGVWLPFTTGKSLALLSVRPSTRLIDLLLLMYAFQLEPRRLLYLLDFPIRAIRVITDPIVDTVMLFLGRAVVPPIAHLAQYCLKCIGRVCTLLMGETLSHKGINTITSLVSNVLHTTEHVIAY